MNTDTQFQPLILAGQGYSLEIAPEANAQKAELLKHSALILEVRDPAAKEASANQRKKLADVRIAVEKCRKKIKEPVLKVGKMIDDTAATFIQEIEAEEKRLSKLEGDYAMAVEAERRRLLQEMEAKRQKEERERQEAEQAAKKAAEEAAAAAKAKEAALWADDDEAAKKAEEQEQAAKKAAEEAAAAAAERARQSSVIAPAPAPVQGVSYALDFEVANIERLYHSRPELVKMEARRAEILAFLKTLDPDDPQLETNCTRLGLRVFKKPIVR